MKKYNNIELLRSYSTIFSGTSFSRLILKDDYSFISSKIERYDSRILAKKENYTFGDYIKHVYKVLCKHYRNEYIYKNTIINEILIKKYGLKDTVAINEFKVGSSVADLVMFNGTSKAFEIKTELDSKKRLDGQLTDYQKLFRQCYIVTHESLLEKYKGESETNGIIVLAEKNGKLILEEVAAPKMNYELDANVLIRSLRTTEYKNIVHNYYGELPNVGAFAMFEECNNLIRKIPADKLHQLMMNEFKHRKTNNEVISTCSLELKQICLSLNLNQKSFSILTEKMNRPILQNY
jgi:hypothetical protein